MGLNLEQKQAVVSEIAAQLGKAQSVIVAEYRGLLLGLARAQALGATEVEVVNDHPSGEEIFLASLGPGEYFGEVGLVHDRPRMATVRAITEVEMMTLDREAFRELLSESERTSQAIAAVISERLAAL